MKVYTIESGEVSEGAIVEKSQSSIYRGYDFY